MARTISQIKAELDKIFPREWSENAVGSALVTGIASVLATREALFDGAGGWLEQMFAGTALGFWLDEHGADYAIERGPGETDDDYRARIGWSPQILTEGNAVAELSRFLPAEGYSVVIEEPHANVLGDGFFLDDTSSLLTDRDGPKFLFWIFIPTPEVVYLLDSFLDVDLFLGVESYLDETQNDLDRQHIRQIFDAAETRRGFGIAWGSTVSDLAQLPYFAGLFKARPGGYENADS